jgi:hypothetical protein
MKIELPVPNVMKLQVNRSKAGLTETFTACSVETFDLPEYDSTDVHPIAEWRQSWGKEYAEPSQQPGYVGTGWNDQFLEDKSFMRLVMIDGAFYSPLKHSIGGRPTDFLRVVDLKRAVSELYDAYSFSGSDYGGVWSTSYRGLISQSGFIRHPDDDGQDVVPDMKGRTLLSQSADRTRKELENALQKMASIDGMIWEQVEEPILVLNTVDGKAVLQVNEAGRMLMAPDRAVAFSFLDYEAAVEFAAVNFADRILQRLITPPLIVAPSVFRAKIEADEMLRCVDYMVQYAADHLKVLPRPAGDAWYALRDLRGDVDEVPSPERLEEMAEAARRFAVALGQQTYKDKIVQEMSVTGLMLTERWSSRPVGGDFGI